MYSPLSLPHTILSDIGKTLSDELLAFLSFSGYHISITILSAFTAHLRLCPPPVSNRLVSQTLYSFPKLPERLMGVDPIGHVAPCMA